VLTLTGCTTGSPHVLLIPTFFYGTGTKPLPACTSTHPTSLVRFGTSPKCSIFAVTWVLLAVANFRGSPTLDFSRLAV
jgi:hypothetical protein